MGRVSEMLWRWVNTSMDTAGVLNWISYVSTAALLSGGVLVREDDQVPLPVLDSSAPAGNLNLAFNNLSPKGDRVWAVVTRSRGRKLEASSGKGMS